MTTLMRGSCLVLLLASGGCVRPDVAPRFTPSWESVDLTTEGWVSTRRVLVVADCQLHNVLSRPLPERNLTAEAAAATAIRPPQLDLFSADVLGWILREGAPDAEAVVHLGDACDLACEGEFTTFIDVMQSCGKPWLMAPGNHDFFYFGTYDPEDTGLWDDACFADGARLPKDRFVRLYAAALVRQRGPGFDQLAAALDLATRRDESVEALAESVPDQFTWSAPEDAGGLLRRIAWRIDRAEPWRSFVLQEADLSVPGATEHDAHAILLDSCQYQRRPGLIPNAWQSWPLALNVGFTAQLLPDQLRLVREWIESAPVTRAFTLMSHHPFDAYEPRSRASVGWLWREHRVGLMVTAHTHHGYFAYHDLGGGSDELELNLGSTTDWPMEWRVLSGHFRTADRKAYIKLDRHMLVDELRARGGFFAPGWEVPIDAPDDYRRYKVGQAASALIWDFYLAHHLTPPWLPQPHVRANAAAAATEEQVKDTLLWTYWRLVTEFPTDPTAGRPHWPERCGSDAEVLQRIVDVVAQAGAIEPKIGLLGELRRFERSRATREPDTGASTDEARARFKLSQAAWASRFESSQGRRLSVEDDLVEIDWARTAEKAERIQRGR